MDGLHPHVSTDPTSAHLSRPSVNYVLLEAFPMANFSLLLSLDYNSTYIKDTSSRAVLIGLTVPVCLGLHSIVEFYVMLTVWTSE